MQASDTAQFLGLGDRGLLKPGLRADINIIDFDNLELLHPTMLQDLPAGGQRLMQYANGYVATLVQGEAIAKNGKLTGARPGRLVRAGR
jgi:N-acyl-D-aspartate/D-glutamate deacylase